MEKTILAIIGVILIIIGLMGFISPMVFGIFAMNTVNSIVYLLTGALSLAFANQSFDEARGFAKVFGIIYLVFVVAGFLMGSGTLFGIMVNNAGDNWLNLIVALLFLYVGFFASQARTAGAVKY